MKNIGASLIKKIMCLGKPQEAPRPEDALNVRGDGSRRSYVFKQLLAAVILACVGMLLLMIWLIAQAYFGEQNPLVSVYIGVFCVFVFLVAFFAWV